MIGYILKNAKNRKCEQRSYIDEVTVNWKKIIVNYQNYNILFFAVDSGPLYMSNSSGLKMLERSRERLCIIGCMMNLSQNHEETF